MDLVTRKGVYEFTDSWDKLEETILPRKEDFYSTLTEELIDDENFTLCTCLIIKLISHFKQCDSDLMVK